MRVRSNALLFLDGRGGREAVGAGEDGGRDGWPPPTNTKLSFPRIYSGACRRGVQPGSQPQADPGIRCAHPGKMVCLGDGVRIRDLSSICDTNQRHPSAGWDPDSRTDISLIWRQFPTLLLYKLGPSLRWDDDL